MDIVESQEFGNVPLMLECKYFRSVNSKKDKIELAGLLSLLGSYARTKKIESIKVFNRFNPDLKFVSENKGRNLTCHLGGKELHLKRNMLLDGRDMYELVE